MKTRLIISCLLTLTWVSQIFAQSDIPSVRVIYLVSADRQERADYKAAIEMAILDIQQWYKKQMNGRTFRLNEPIVEVLKSNQPANWFTGTPISGVREGDWGIQHTLSEVKRLLPQESIPGNYTWVMYSDGPGSSGRGGGQICYLPEDDLLGLTGTHPTQPDIPRWIAGLGHEIGHAFGLPHPADTRKHEDAIMWTGIYGKYPNQTYLTPEDKAMLVKSPFFMTDSEIADREVVWQTTYSYHGGSFVRNKTKGGGAFWTENADDGATYQFQETRSDGRFYYAFGRSVVTLKIPIKGGTSYYSGNNGQNWNTNHYVTITADEKVTPASAENTTTESTGSGSVWTPTQVDMAEVMLPCKDPQYLTNTDPNEATKITFTNHLEEEVRLYWINYDQQPVAYLTIQPGEQGVQQTYSNHWWMAKTTSGACVGIFKNTTAKAVTVDIERQVTPIRWQTVDETELKKKN